MILLIFIYILLIYYCLLFLQSFAGRYRIVMEYFILALLWFLWCVLHSWMISSKTTQYLKLHLGSGFRFYRLFYNIVSLLTFFAVMYYGSSIQTNVLFKWGVIFNILRFFLLLTAGFVFYSGAKHYSMPQFIGIQQIRSGKVQAALSNEGSLNRSGILSIVRHPWYLGAFILIWSGYGEFYISTAVTNVILSVYLILGSVLEERKLLKEFKEEYRKYQEEVSMIFPFKYIISVLKNTILKRKP